MFWDHLKIAPFFPSLTQLNLKIYISTIKKTKIYGDNIGQHIFYHRQKLSIMKSISQKYHPNYFLLVINFEQKKRNVVINIKTQTLTETSQTKFQCFKLTITCIVAFMRFYRTWF